MCSTHINLWDVNRCSLSNTKQMEHLADTKQGQFSCKGVYSNLWCWLFRYFFFSAKLSTVKVLLFVVVNKDWTLYQLDFKNVFLSADLVEEVYMSPSPRFEAQFGHQVCKLQKSLYGLKQLWKDCGSCCICWWHRFMYRWSGIN